MKPILFNTEMVQAIQEGRKTVTRRVVKPQPPATSVVRKRDCSWDWTFWADSDDMGHLMLPPYQPGDILWVRETWYKDVNRYMYKASYTNNEKFFRGGKEVRINWSPSIHMPMEAARLSLRVTGVRVERLQDITEEQAIMEGIFLDSPDFIPTYHSDKSKCNMPGRGWNTARECFLWGVWNSTIKPADLPLYGWKANPWVWVIEFERISKETAIGGGGDG